MGNTDRSVVDAIGAKALDLIKNQVGHRLDLHLADFRMAGPTLAAASVTYSNRVGEPTSDMIQDYVINAFDGKVVPFMSTCRIHREAQAVTLNVGSARPSRPVKDTNRMVPAGPNRYIEASTREVWEVEDNNGTPALYRVAEEDLEDLLAKKQHLAARTASSDGLLINLRENGRALATPGANVMFFTSEGEERVGKVMAEPDEYGYLPVVVTDESISTRIHANQISEMLTTAEVDQNTQGALKEYYTKAFGDAEYAQNLVDGKSFVGTKDDLVAFLVQGGFTPPGSAMAVVDTMRTAPGVVFTVGPSNVVLAEYNGFGYEWELDLEKIEALLQ